jgi:hypothetical protein
MAEAFMLCRERRKEAKRTGLVMDCVRTRHACAGPRVAYRWLARGPHGEPFISRQSHCMSCSTDEEFYGYRDRDESCCCVHATEYERRCTAATPEGKP